MSAHVFTLETNNLRSYEEIPEQICKNMLKNVQTYIYPPFCCIGFILNILCIIVFSNKKFEETSVKHVMFKYLLYKSVFDAIILFLKTIHPLFECDQNDVLNGLNEVIRKINRQTLNKTENSTVIIERLISMHNSSNFLETISNPNNKETQNCILKQSYFLNIFKLITINYFIYVCTLCSIIFELAAQLDRLITISCAACFWSKQRYYPSYKIASILIFLTCVICYTYKLRMYKIEQIKLDSEENEPYSIVENEDPDGKFNQFEIIHTTIRDVVCVFLLLILDIFILVVFKRIMSKKKILVVSGGSGRQSSLKEKNPARRSINMKFVQKISNAENRTTLMVIIIGFMALIGRLPLFYNYIHTYFNVLKDFEFNLCIQSITESLFLLNISSNFFIYYSFNRPFKNMFRRLFGYEYRDYERSFRNPNGKRSSLKSKLEISQNTPKDHFDQIKLIEINSENKPEFQGSERLKIRHQSHCGLHSKIMEKENETIDLKN